MCLGSSEDQGYNCILHLTCCTINYLHSVASSHLKGLFSHCECSLVGEVPSNEAIGMYKHTPWDSTDLRQLLIPYTTPLSWEGEPIKMVCVHAIGGVVVVVGGGVLN